MATSADAIDWGLAHIDSGTRYSLSPRETDLVQLGPSGLIRFADCSSLIVLCLKAVGIFDRLYIPAYESTYAFMLAMGKLTNLPSSPGTGIGLKKPYGYQNWERFEKLAEWDNTAEHPRELAYDLLQGNLQKGDILIKYPFSPGRNNAQGHMAFVVSDDGSTVELFEALPSPAEPEVGIHTYDWIYYDPSGLESFFNLAVRPTPFNNTPHTPGPTFLRNS